MKFGKQFAVVSLVLASVVPALAQFRSGGISPSLQLLSIPEVRKELKLSDAQTGQLQEIQRNLKADMLKMFRGLKDVAPKERAVKFEAFRTDLDRKLVVVLDPGQRKRLHELELQREGTRALLKPDVGAELRLTSTQKEKLSRTAREEQQSIRELYKQLPNDNDPNKVLFAHQQLDTLRARTEGQLFDVLTGEQKKQFQTMKGAPFKFPEEKTPGVTVRKTGAKPAGSN